MDFFNFLTSADKMLNFKLAPSTSQSIQSSPHNSSSSAFRKVPSLEIAQPLPQLPKEAVVDMDKIVRNALMQMQERQRLINQYLQLNIQMLEKEIQNKEKGGINHSPEDLPLTPKEQEGEIDLQGKQKKIKKLNTCGHEDRPHYAKKMCSNCYHRYGRVKKPWRCSHEKLYAAGMCQNCYINDYNKKRREQVSKEEGKIDCKGESMDGQKSQ